MGKRAVIYVRTSSEMQGEKNSPVEQEADCREFAEQQGFVVVNVYRDIQRYRIKNKWIEPSGTRYDRPGLLAMLRDAGDDQFDIIIAWREDRLYRGMRAMLLVLEAIQQNKLTIMLAKEIYDPAIAPLKAWLAQVELEHINERMSMGVKARLRAGKANSGQDRYGYQRNGEVIEVVPEEAVWVRQIFDWYIQGVYHKTIRKRLIAANAPQKEFVSNRRIQWSLSSIQSILKGAKEYANGTKIQSRGGESFSIPVEPIISMETYEKYLEVKQRYQYPPTNIPKRDFLVRGLLFCPCGYKMQSLVSKTSRKNWDGEWQAGKIYGSYICACKHDELVSPDCPRRVKNALADEDVWMQVCNAINKPEILIEKARDIVDELKENALTYNEEKERIEKTLGNLIIDRQWVITQALKKSISEDEMERKLNDMSLLEASLKRDLNSLQETINIQLLENWEDKVKQYLEDLQEGIQALNDIPATPREQIEVYELRRKIIETLVEKVVVDKDLRLIVTIRINLLSILEESMKSGDVKDESGGGHWPSSNSGTRSLWAKKKSIQKMKMAQIRVSGVWQG